MATNTIQCKTCGKTIAKSATRCPQCGERFTNFGTAVLAFLGWTVIILGSLATFTGNLSMGVPVLVAGILISVAGEALKRGMMR